MSPREPRVLIVGAGFGGIAAAIELQRHGFDDVTILERAPRARRHVAPQHLPGRGLRRPEPPLLVLLRAAPRLVAAVLAAARDPRLPARASRASTASTGSIVTGAEVDARARWDDDARRWTVDDAPTAAAGRPTRSIVATGQLHQPALPADRRASTLRGHSFHSAEWDHDYDLRGKRVAVIGTGASAVQFVPEIAEQVARLVGLPAHGQLVPAAQEPPLPARRCKALDRARPRRAGVPARGSCSSTASR